MDFRFFKFYLNIRIDHLLNIKLILFILIIIIQDIIYCMENKRPFNIVQLTSERIQEAVEILSHSFLSLNDIWKAFNPVLEEIVPFVRHKITQSVKDGLSFFIQVDGKMVGLTVQYDAVDYLNMPPYQTPSILFNTLARYAQKIQTAISEGNYKRGECLIGGFGVIDPTFASKGFSIDFWHEGFVYFQNKGYKQYYSRVSSPVSLFILKKFGAVEVKSTQFQQQALKGHKLTLMSIDFSKPLPSLESLKKKKQKKQ